MRGNEMDAGERRKAIQVHLAAVHGSSDVDVSSSGFGLEDSDTERAILETLEYVGKQGITAEQMAVVFSELEMAQIQAGLWIGWKAGSLKVGLTPDGQITYRNVL